MRWFRSFRALMIYFSQQDVNIFDMYVIMHDRVDSSQRDTVVQILNHAFH